MSLANVPVAPAAIPKRYYSLAEIAVYTGASEKFLRLRINDGSLKSSLVSGRRFITLAQADQMMEQHANRRPRRGRGIKRATK